MADPILQQLNAISAAGTTAAQFLQNLGPIHNNWHLAHINGTAQTGFLLFHWELLRRFEAVGGPAHFGGTSPFTIQQLASLGASYNVSTVVSSGSMNSLQQFSGDIENWHNHAHMAIGNAFGVNLMNPITNVLLVQFWQLHYFINARFEEKLAIFHPATGIPTVVAQLEGHHVAPHI